MLEPHLFLQEQARGLLAVHALCALALLATTSWLVVVSFRGGGEARVSRAMRRAGGLFVVVFVLGLLMYPHYRYHVRGLVLDRRAPGASNLFDIKEGFAALGLPLALALVALGGRPLASGELDLRVVRLFAVLLWGLILFNVVSGFWVAHVQRV